MKTIYLWVSGKGWTPFQYNELSELSSEFEARNIKLGDGCELGDGCKLGDECACFEACICCLPAGACDRKNNFIQKLTKK